MNGLRPSVPTGTFPRQFVLARDLRSVPSGWSRETMHGWSLWHCPLLRLRPIVDQLGTAVGWLLGEGGWDDGEAKAVQIDCPLVSPQFVPMLEALLRGSAGSLVAIVPGPPVARIYTGPGGMLGVVYNAAEGCVASSPGLAATVRHPDVELIRALDIPTRNHYFPFGLTPEQQVRRLLPNHFLDLGRFREERCWPTSDVRFGTAAHVDPLVDAIAYRVRQTVETIAGTRRIGLSLTAGHDSRMVLAATQRVRQSVSCYTVGWPDAHAQLDCRVAAAIARRVGVRHDVIAYVEPDVADLDEWQERTGHCVAGRSWLAASLRKRFSDGTRLSGMCGEVGRAFYWRKENLDGGQVSASSIVERLGLPAHSRLCLEAERWLGSLPVTEAPQVLDLLYIEQRLGCWAAPAAYGQSGDGRTPLNDNQVFEWMLTLPYDYRFQQKLAPAVIERLWPDLLAVPFNQEFGVRRLATNLRKRARQVVARLTH